VSSAQPSRPRADLIGLAGHFGAEYRTSPFRYPVVSRPTRLPFLWPWMLGCKEPVVNHARDNEDPQHNQQPEIYFFRKGFHGQGWQHACKLALHVSLPNHPPRYRTVTSSHHRQTCTARCAAMSSESPDSARAYARWPVLRARSPRCSAVALVIGVFWTSWT
jgi:hypothetical protein